MTAQFAAPMTLATKIRRRRRRHIRARIRHAGFLRSAQRDRAAIVATSVMQIVTATPTEYVHRRIEAFLRDELAERQAAGGSRLG
jgi:hypothetical protein